jgi:hypothetical protein
VPEEDLPVEDDGGPEKFLRSVMVSTTVASRSSLLLPQGPGEFAKI